MSKIARMMQQATAGAGGAGLDVDSLFSTFLYDGGGAKNITNSIDFSNEGGMVWIKARDDSTSNHFYDTERGVLKRVTLDTTEQETTDNYSLSEFKYDGFTLLGDLAAIGLNKNNKDYVSWSWRKAKNWFDIQTYTGNGSSQTISHDLGCEVGMMFIKKLTGGTANWMIWHRSLGGANKYIRPTPTAMGTSTTRLNNTLPTSSGFTVGNDGDTNSSGANYVCYLFAHNNNDGGFGPSGDQDIIKCGSFTPPSSGEAEVNLGFEPQFIITFDTTGGDNWRVYDIMRGWNITDRQLLNPNEPNQESTLSNTSGYELKPTLTGFIHEGHSASDKHIYMAIRRGPLAVPEDATKVYKAGLVNGPNTNYTVNSGFPVDLAFRVGRSGTTSHHLLSRIAGGKTQISTTTARSSFNDTIGQIDSSTGIYGGTSQSYNTIHHMFRRSSNFFEAVAYVGNGTATGSSSRTINHPLGVTPEFIIFVTDNGSSSSKYVYHSSLSANNPISLNGNYKPFSSRTDFFANPTDTQLNVREILDTNGTTYIAYCFATLAGISKVGSYSGNGSNQTIDCGFTSGARFVLIKRTDSGSNEGDDNSHWYIIDSTRGIVSGNDPYSVINKAYFENTVASASYNSNPEDVLDPASTGFIVNQNTTTDLNKSSATYIFYAVA